jgi:hypothetical protein
MKKCLVLTLLTLALSGCASLNPFHGLSDPPQAPKKMGSWEQTSKPVLVGTIDGKTIVANEITYRASAEETSPKATVGQRIGSFFSNLSLAGVLFVLLSLVFFGGAPIIWVARKYFAAKQALKSTIKAIKEIPSDQFEAIKPALAANQDKADKELIAKLKAKL